VYRDLRLIGGGVGVGLLSVVAVVVVRQVEEEDVLADAVVAAAEALVAVEAEPEAAALFHLGLRQAFHLAAVDGGRCGRGGRWPRRGQGLARRWSG